MVDDAGKKLETFTEQVINTITELKQQTQTKLDVLRQELEQLLSDQTTSLTKELNEAKLVLEKTKRATTDSNNPSQQIVCSSLAVIVTHTCLEVNKRLECPDITNISFLPHFTHEKLFGSLLTYTSLGEFKALHRVKLDNATQTIKVEEVTRNIVVTKAGPYTITKVEAVNINLTGDKSGSVIYESCSLQDGTILLADYTSVCIKRVSPLATSLSDSLKLPDAPLAICNINEQEAVVTLYTKQQVQMISLGPTMKATQSFKVDFYCRGIAYHGAELFITDSTTVYVYNLTGKRLRQFSRDHNSGLCMFSHIYNIAVSASGRVVFIADGNNGLIAVDSTSGCKVWQYNAGDLVNASGVCIDGCGSVFVCGSDSHNVLQFNETGERLGEIVSQTDGVVYPLSVCFDKTKSTLVVAKQDGRNALLRFSLART